MRRSASFAPEVRNERPRRGLLARGRSSDPACLPKPERLSDVCRPDLSAYSGGTAWALHPLPRASGLSVVEAECSTLKSRGFPVQSRLRAAGLGDIDDKLLAGVRLTLEDGVRLFDHPDLLAVGWLANREREKRHERRTYFNYNLRLEPTNVCEASCLFCSFARLKPGMPEAYTMSLEEAWDKLRQRANQPLTEVHIV